MTQIEKAEVQKRLANLKAQREQLIGNLNQLNGAIAFAEGLLAPLPAEAPKTAEEPKKRGRNKLVPVPGIKQA